MAARDVVSEIAQDAPARQRVRNGVDVEIRRGSHGILTSVDADGFAIITCIENDADAGRFHEAMAATCLEALRDLDELERGVDR